MGVYRGIRPIPTEICDFTLLDTFSHSCKISDFIFLGVYLNQSDVKADSLSGMRALADRGFGKESRKYFQKFADQV